MSSTVTKRLNVSDVFTIPYKANKLWSVPSSSFTSESIYFEIGTNTTSSLKTEYTQENLLYKSVLLNYYPEFYPTSSHTLSSYNQTNNYNLTLSTSSYNGFQNLGNLTTTEKYYPTSSNAYIYTVNIPKSLYSEKIQPLTFRMEVAGGTIYDDGEYNLRWSGSGTYLSKSGSSLIRLNSGSLPDNMLNLTISSSVYPILSKTSTSTFTISASIYVNSSSYTINYFTSSQETGNDLTMFNVQVDTTSAYNTITSRFSSSATVLNFTSSNTSPWTFTAGPAPLPSDNLSSSFGGGPPYDTVLTITPGTGYFLYGGLPQNSAYIASITGSVGVPPFNTSVTLSPGYTILTLPPSSSTVTLTKTSQSYQPSTVVTQSSVIFPADVVNKSGSLTINSVNYPIVNRISSIAVELGTALVYTSSTNFTFNYTSSAIFNSSNISAGGLIPISSPNVSSSINTLITQSGYVGNIFYEQGLGVLTVVPLSIIP